MVCVCMWIVISPSVIVPWPDGQVWVLLRRQSLGEPSWRTTYLVDQLVEVDEIGSGPLQGPTRKWWEMQHRYIYLLRYFSIGVYQHHLR